MELTQLKDKYDLISSSFHKMIGIRDHFDQEKVKLFMELEDLNEFLDSKEEVQRVLHELQTRTQSRTKDIYENLLTTLVKDIMPDNEESDSVILNTGVRNNRTTLNIDVANKKGFARDVYLDKGGSIENIVAMGLRFIALSRTSNRRFLILDEADSWLKDIYIPAFAEVLCQLSRRVGIQVVYISHHGVENFAGKAKIINLSRDNGRIVAEDISHDGEAVFEGVDDDDLPELMDGVGIKYLRLVNIKQHENTLLELSPNVTIITGDNDIGKTTILQALEAVNQNSGRDGLIRDDQPYCRVEVGLEDDMTLAWTYKRKGQKRTQYILTDDENSLIKKSDSGKEVPDWLHDYLAMGLYKEFDLHIGDQHSASFILDKKISAHRRAEILSLGKEASKVQRMITLHGEKVSFSKKELNRKKKEMNAIKDKLAVMRTLGKEILSMKEIANAFYDIQELSEDLNDIKIKAQVIKKLEDYNSVLFSSKDLRQIESQPVEEQAEKIIGKLTRLISLEEKNSLLSRIKNIQPVEISEYENLSNLSTLEIKVSRFLNKKNTLLKAQDLTKLVLPNVERLDNILISGKQIALLEKKQAALSSSASLKTTIMTVDADDNSEGIKNAGRKIAELLKKQLLLKCKMEGAQQEKVNSDNDLNNYISEIGGICPTCNGQFSENTHMEACQ